MSQLQIDLFAVRIGAAASEGHPCSGRGREALGGVQEAKCPRCGEVVLVARTRLGKELLLDQAVCQEGEWSVGEDGGAMKVPGDGHLLHAGSCAWFETCASGPILEQPTPSKLAPAPCHDLFSWLAVAVDPVTARVAQEFERIGCYPAVALGFALEKLRRSSGYLPVKPPKLEVPVDVFGTMRRILSLSESERKSMVKNVIESMSSGELSATTDLAKKWVNDVGLSISKSSEIFEFWACMIWEIEHKAKVDKT